MNVSLQRVPAGSALRPLRRHGGPQLQGALVVAVLLLAPGAVLAAPATIKVFEAQVHSAPDPSSPVIHTFPENARVSVSEEAYGAFRKVRLPDGGIGYVEERALSVAAAPRAPPPQASPPSTPQVPPTPPPEGPPPPPSYAGPPPPPPPAWPPYRAAPYPVRVYDPRAYRHLGFFLRFDLGLGYMNSYRPRNAPSSATTFDTSDGVAFAPSFAIGGTLAENLILAGHFWGSWVTTPSLSAGGASIPAGGDFSHSLFGLGPNLTWYFMPQNVYLSVTPSVTWVNFSDFFHSVQTEPGFGTRFAIGKEWWVGPHVGLGLAGWFAFSFNREGGGATLTWRTYTGGLAFSTTIN